MGFDLATDTLILRSMRILDDAHARIEAISDLLWRRMGQEMEGHLAAVRPNEDWTVDDWDFEHDPTFAPTRWRAEPGEELDAWFNFTTGHGDSGEWAVGEDRHYLTRLLGVGRGHLRFAFHLDRLKGKAWRQLRADRADLFGKLPIPLDRAGTPYTPVQMDGEVLAEAIATEDFSEAFAPLRQSVDRILSAMPILDEVVASARLKTSAEGGLS